MNLVYLKRQTLKKETCVTTKGHSLHKKIRTMLPNEKHYYLYSKFVKFKQQAFNYIKQTYSPHYVKLNYENLNKNELIKKPLYGEKPTYYQLYKIESLVKQRYTKYNCTFKEDKLLNSFNEYISKYYEVKFSQSKIKSIIKIPQKYIPILYPHGIIINTYFDRYRECNKKYNDALIEKFKQMKGKFTRNKDKKKTLKELVSNKTKHSLATNSFCSSIHESQKFRSLLNENKNETESTNKSQNYKSEINKCCSSKKNIKRSEKEEHSIELIEKIIDFIQRLEDDKNLLIPQRRPNQKCLLLHKQSPSLKIRKSNKVLLTSLHDEIQNKSDKTQSHNKHNKNNSNLTRLKNPLQTFKFIQKTPEKDSTNNHGLHKYKSIGDFVKIKNNQDKKLFKKKKMLKKVLHQYAFGIHNYQIYTSLQEKIPFKNKSSISHKFSSNNNSSVISLSNTINQNKNPNNIITNENIPPKKTVHYKSKSQLISERLFKTSPCRNLTRNGKIIYNFQQQFKIIEKTESLIDKTKKLLLNESTALNNSSSINSIIKCPLIYRYKPTYHHYKYI